MHDKVSGHKQYKHGKAKPMDLPDIINDLSNRYCEPHRFYHSLHHIERMINELNTRIRSGEISLTDQQFFQIYWAIEYHDAVYETHPQTLSNRRLSNEQMSAQLYTDHWLAAEQIPDPGVIEMILATEHHFNGKEQPWLTSLMLDLDLISFTDEWDQLVQTNINIDKEWLYHSQGYTVYPKRHKFLNEIFNRGALNFRVLKRGIDHDKIYYNLERLVWLYAHKSMLVKE